jgi:methyl-accepting chemotaxis protein
MENRVGSGRGLGPTAEGATAEATRKAVDGLSGAKATFGFLFASPLFSISECLRTARARAGTADIVGCTTAGEFTQEGLIHGGVVVLLVAGQGTHQVASTRGVAAQPAAAAARLCEGFPAAKKQALLRGLINSTTFTLVDGLSGAGERYVEALVSHTSALHPVVGGAAGDEGKFEATHVGGNGHEGRDVAAAVHVFSRTPFGVGVGHGLSPTTASMRVTRAKANVVSEIDGKPAFAIYEEHARKRGITLTPKGAGEYLIANELGILVGREVTRARAPLSVGSDGSLTCAADVPQGSFVSILDGEPDRMVAAAGRAALEARAGLQGAQAGGVLLFDCICRGLILKEGFQREIDAVRSVMGDVPVAGFLTYGEIASYAGGIDAWHNTTAVVVAIPQ